MSKTLEKLVVPAVLYLLFGGLPAWATNVQLINNGTFETGNLSGWTESDQSGGSGSWFAVSGTTEPLSGISTVGAAGGTYYASTDQTGPGAHVLIQTFTDPVGAISAHLTFDMFVNNYAGVTYCGSLDYTVNPTECGRVDILAAGSNPFTTTTGVLDNLFNGSDSGTNPNAYTAYNFDLSSILTPGTTYELRFAEADNQNFFNMGVDNVSLGVSTMAVTPEPPAGILWLTGIGLLGLVMRKRIAQGFQLAN